MKIVAKLSAESIGVMAGGGSAHTCCCRVARAEDGEGRNRGMKVGETEASNLLHGHECCRGADGWLLGDLAWSSSRCVMTAWSALRPRVASSLMVTASSALLTARAC